jgi:16S rRNA (uracil1498-N3)-methyltransferase
MTRPTFVHPEVHGAGVGARLRLEGPEGHHASVVRRLRVGEVVHVTDGRGAQATGEVVVVGKGMVELDVTDVEEHAQPRPRLVVVQALVKGDRGELAVELLTEVGADVVVPWAAERCVVKWSGDRGDKALRRWRATAYEAAKQSRRTWFPEVLDLHRTADVARLVESADTALVLHEEATAPLGAVPLGESIVVVVGPEGGITDAEVSTLVDAGATAVRMGSSVLRASTAGVVAAGALLSRTPRWS